MTLFRPPRDGAVRGAALGMLWILGSARCAPDDRSSGTRDSATEADATEIRELAFVSDRDGELGLYVLSVATGDVGPGSVATAVVVLDSGTLYGPAWSPDGRRLTYEADADGDLDVFIVDRDGGGRRALTDNDVYDGTASWSPPRG